MDKQFDKMDLVRIYNASCNKTDGYKMWLVKQHMEHCGTRIQFGYYSGNINGGTSCPNCGDQKSAAHLCMFPNGDRVRLFTERVDELNNWLENKTQVIQKIVFGSQYTSSLEHKVTPRPGDGITEQDSPVKDPRQGRTDKLHGRTPYQGSL